MKGLQQLINQLCPNGVEWKTLGEVAKVKRGDRITKKDLIPNGKYPVMSGGTCFFGRYSKYNRCANTITVAQYGSAGFVSFVTEDFWANDVCYSVFPLDIIVNKYLYYCLVNNQQVLYSLTTKAIPDCLPQNRLESLQIPLPPLAIQSRIVEILDHFTNLTANLTAELAQRRKQFDHYRESLLSFGDEVEWKTLESICTLITDGSHSSPKSCKNGYYMPSVKDMRMNGFDFSDCKQISEEDYNSLVHIGCKPKVNDVLIAKYGSMLKYAFHIKEESEIVVLSSIAIIRPIIDIIRPDFLAHYFRRNRFRELVINEFSTKGGVPRIVLKNFKKIKIQIPPLAVQQSIVEQLDKFTALIQNIENELALRQKQYEYYREQLLSFPQSARNS